MTHLQFKQKQLNDPDFSFNREILLTNSRGGYSSSTISGCNTRKYHGLLIAPQPQFNQERFLFLSSLDETLVYKGKSVQLSTHRYDNTTYPSGYMHQTEFKLAQFPFWEFGHEGFHITKELLMSGLDHRIFIIYNILKAPVPSFEFELYPLTAFRNTHTLCRSNTHVNTRIKEIQNGISVKLYPGFSDLHMQFSRKNEFVHNPDWYYNLLYEKEMSRGYDYTEDLYCPGHFKLSMKAGDRLVFCAGLQETGIAKLRGLINAEYKRVPLTNSLKDYLNHAAGQFIFRDDTAAGINAGYHWFGQWGRDTFIALPGLTLINGKHNIFKDIVRSSFKDLKKGLFPNCGQGASARYNSADASLWFFWAIQQYALYAGNIEHIWKEYGTKMKSILKHFHQGTDHHIHMENNGLLYAGETGVALTWMDAVVDGKPVTPRTGYAVELNALWYNAICFSIEAAKAGHDHAFVKSWAALPAQIEATFIDFFWDPASGYLADCVHGEKKDMSLRPNQIFALSLPYSPVNKDIRASVLKIVREKLLTPRGLRSLSPDEMHYHGRYAGDQKTRDMAYHQGTIWPWLLGHYAEALIKDEGETAIPELRSLFAGFTPAIGEYGLGTVAEVYDGDAPHSPGGAISQAWSIAELLRMNQMLEIFEKRIRSNNAPAQTQSS